MEKTKFKRLVSRGIVTADALEQFVRDATGATSPIENHLLARGVPKHEILLCLSDYYGYPYVEYEESIIVSRQIVRGTDMERLKKSLWMPLSIRDDKAEVIACYPDDAEVLNDIRKTLGVRKIDFKVCLPADLVRIIEHNQDVNPGFPPAAGRTPLAKARTFLAERRSMLSCHRTALAKGRTGLAFLRTGLSFIAISLGLFRIFGMGYLAFVEGILLISGLIAVIDGLLWYLPARMPGKKRLQCGTTDPTGGTSVLAVSNAGEAPAFKRTAEAPGAGGLREGWDRLSPVMRRRFLASDRTDFAEERTVLACYRTVMARARTGLAFTRTGIAFIGLGIAMLRQFHVGPWTSLDAAIILSGAAMVAEGFYWYLPGRRAGAQGDHAVKDAQNKNSIWNSVFPFILKDAPFRAVRTPFPPVKGYQSPGIWATTGLALERTLLAERRNVMARLRTVMARSRTGMAFIRTGMSMSAVGLGLLVYFGLGSLTWNVAEIGMTAAGLLFIADGLSWYLPAEKTRKQFPYCFSEMEIAAPDYGVPARNWRKAVFSHDDI